MKSTMTDHEYETVRAARHKFTEMRRQARWSGIDTTMIDHILHTARYALVRESLIRAGGAS